MCLWFLSRKPRYSDPTYIRYFFYFADEIQKLAADYNELAQDLQCAPISEQVLQEHINQMDGGEKKSYCYLYQSQYVVCLLHAVKDTLIWQVAYSAGKEIAEPKVGWEASKKFAWEKVKGAYGSSELFVMNVGKTNLRKEAERLYGVIRELRPDLPPLPEGGDAVGETDYFLWIGGDTFLLLVGEGSKELKSANFQCGTFPRLMMQVCKARHYERLVADSVEMVKQVTKASTLGNRRYLFRLVEVSLIDIGVMVRNVEFALKSYDNLVREWVERNLPGEAWNQLRRQTEIWLESAQVKQQNLESEKNLIEQKPERPLDLDERIENLSDRLDRELCEEIRGIHRTLRYACYPAGVINSLTRVSLRLMNLLFRTVDQKAPTSKARPSDNLYDCIIRAGKGDERSKGLGILPDEIASCLHTIRTYSNKADHDAEKVRLMTIDAEICLLLFLRVLEWFYCEYEKGPKLPTIYKNSGICTY